MTAALDALPESLPDVAAGVRAAFAKAMNKASRKSSAQGGAANFAPSAQSAAEHGHITRICAAVQNKQLAKATQHLFAMRDAGYKVPPSCLVIFARLATETEEGRTVLKDLPSDVLSNEAVAALLDHAVKGGDSVLLREMHGRLDVRSALSSPPVCEALLR